MKNRRPLVTLIIAILLIGVAAYFARSNKSAPSIALNFLSTTASSPNESTTGATSDESNTLSKAPKSAPPSPIQLIESQTKNSIQSASPEVELAKEPDVSEPLVAQFETLQKQAFDAIPTQSQLSQLNPEEVHFTPKPMLEAAIKIGDVAQLVKDHPELSVKGLEFYKQCAETATSPNSIRASCYAEFNRLSKAHSSRIAVPQVPKAVKNLAEKLPS